MSLRLEYEEIDRERTPLGTLSLHRYTAQPTGEQGYEIRIDGAFLMATHGEHGETAMAGLAHAALRRPAEALHVLIGGLGAGHTLRAALDLPGVARVTVVEIGARVVEWNRHYFAASNGGAVDDPRVRVRVGDLAEVVAAAIEHSDGTFDLMLLDVDNGPGWLAAPGNAGLYEPEGLRRCRAALRPGGALAIWSPTRNTRFLAALRTVFPDAEEIATARIDGSGSGQTDVVYLVVRT